MYNFLFWVQATASGQSPFTRRHSRIYQNQGSELSNATTVPQAGMCLSTGGGGWITRPTHPEFGKTQAPRIVPPPQGRKQVIKRSTHARPDIYMQQCSAVQSASAYVHGATHPPTGAGGLLDTHPPTHESNTQDTSRGVSPSERAGEEVTDFYLHIPPCSLGPLGCLGVLSSPPSWATVKPASAIRQHLFHDDLRGREPISTHTPKKHPTPSRISKTPTHHPPPGPVV